MFQHTKLVNHVETWVFEVNQPILNRAWEIVKECVNAHAIVDREEDQSCKLARAEAWKDWCLAWRGDDTTFALAGLVSELSSACPCGLDDQLEQVVSEGHAMAQGLLKKARRVKPLETQTRAALTLVWNQETDDMEH